MTDVSFERTDTERTVVHRRAGLFGASTVADSAEGTSTAGSSSVTVSRNVADGAKNKVSGDGTAEVEHPVVVAGRAADEHVFEHLLNDAGRTAVANEIGAEFTVRRRDRTACYRAGS